MEDPIEELRSLCKVLGSNFEDKLNDLGSVWEEHGEGEGAAEKKARENRLQRTLELLREVKEERYEKVKEYGMKLMELWKSNDTATSRILDFSETLALYDAASSAESSKQLTGDNTLTIDSIKKMHDEIVLQESLKLNKLEAKFQRRKNKLLSLIVKNHLQLNHANFDLEKKVEFNEDSLAAACKELKDSISNVKTQVFKRKEIIIRTEMLQLAIDQLMPQAKIEGFIQAIKSQVDAFDEGRTFLYDGEDIKKILAKFGSDQLLYKKEAPRSSNSKLRMKEGVLLKGTQEKASGTSRASSRSSGNVGKESHVVAPKKTPEALRSSPRLVEKAASIKKQNQPDLRRCTRLSAKSVPKEGQLIISLPPHPKQHRTPRVEVQDAKGQQGQYLDGGEPKIRFEEQGTHFGGATDL